MIALCAAADIPAPALGELPLHQRADDPGIRQVQRQRLPAALRDPRGGAGVQLPDGAHARYGRPGNRILQLTPHIPAPPTNRLDLVSL